MPSICTDGKGTFSGVRQRGPVAGAILQAVRIPLGIEPQFVPDGVAELVRFLLRGRRARRSWPCRQFKVSKLWTAAGGGLEWACHRPQ